VNAPASKLYRGRPAVVLLVEDKDNDVELTKIGFEQSRFAVDLAVVRDGEQCLAFLRKEGVHAAAATPDLILLDLHLPRMGGMEVLDELRADTRFQAIPIVILTTSDSDREIKSAYERGCRGYLLKPVSFADFVRLVATLQEYWFSLVVLPR
jgi:two-component system, chemotaxis family, response regulator Rcp1